MDLPENHAGEQREAPTPYGAGPLAGLGGAVPESRHPRTHRQSSGSLIPSCRLRSDEENYRGSAPRNPFATHRNSAGFRWSMITKRSRFCSVGNETVTSAVRGGSEGPERASTAAPSPTEPDRGRPAKAPTLVRRGRAEFAVAADTADAHTETALPGSAEHRLTVFLMTDILQTPPMSLHDVPWPALTARPADLPTTALSSITITSTPVPTTAKTQPQIISTQKITQDQPATAHR